MQRITFALDRWNAEDNCAFWTMWGAQAPAYSRWHRQHFGSQPANNALGGASDWNIPGWSRQNGDKPELHNREDDDVVMRSVLADFTGVGFPYLGSISTWKGAAERLLEEDWFYPRAVDFFLLAEDVPRARTALLRGIQRYTKEGRMDEFRELPELRLRLERFFPGVSPGV